MHYGVRLNMLLHLLNVACVSYFLFAVVSVLRSKRKSVSDEVDTPHPAVVFLVGGTIPVIIALVMTYLFIVVGGSTTVQFNAGSASAMDVWSRWVGLWPGFMFISFGSGVWALIWLIVCAIKKCQRSLLIPVTVSLLLSILTFFTVASYFPSA